MEPLPPLITVVDDDEAITICLEEDLRNAGFAPLMFTSGREFLEQYSSLPRPPALVLLDVYMPGLDGLDVLGSLRRQGITTPIFMYSEQPNEQDRIRAKALGATAFFVKDSKHIHDLLDAITAEIR